MVARIKLKTSDLEALKRLRRVALRGCRISAKCPSCGSSEARLVAVLGPGIVVKCPGCGKAWKKVPAHA